MKEKNMITETRHEVSIKTKTLLIAMTALAIFSTSMFARAIAKGVESFSQKVATENVEFKNIK
jgi:hypothetical protein